MRVLKGQEIIEVESGKLMVVEHDFDSGVDERVSEVFDFSAVYRESAGVNQHGERICANRGLRLADEGVVWERGEC